MVSSSTPRALLRALRLEALGRHARLLSSSVASSSQPSSQPSSQSSVSSVSSVSSQSRRSYAAGILGAIGVAGGLGLAGLAEKENAPWPGTRLSQASGPGVVAGAVRPELKTYSKEEVAKHRTKKTGIWVSYKDGVYDVTEWADIHPGGSSRLMLAAGGPIDSFWAMYAQHNTDQVKEILEEYRIGNLEGGAVPVGNPYENQPTDRHPSLGVRSQEPMNAETPLELLAESLLTPNDIFYIRNHLPVPMALRREDYAVQVGGDGLKSLCLSVDELKKNFKQHTIVATIQCTGNRRKDLMDSPSPKEIKGLKWEGSAIGTATWTGVLLRDVLLAAGIDANGSGDGNEPEIKHIRFEGYDEDISGSTYGASIPISKAMDPRGDVLLAFEMNGKELTRDHGYPLRVLVPGVAACRSVKWLKSIEAHAEESTSFWQQNDYKSFSPNVDWDNVDWTSSPAIQNMPVTSAITEPAPGRVHEVPRDGDDDLRVPVKGYAWSGGGNGIVRVDVSVDGGSTWQDATLRKIAQQPGRGWAWALWECDVQVPKGHKGALDVVAKATDESCNTQPERADSIWNLRGVCCNTWPRIQLDIVD
jgi:sulfite oxidase